jgi:hypothetical protein
MVFWALFLLLELPCSVIGLRFTTRSEKLKQVNNVKREIAWGAGIFIGVSGSLAGVFTLGLLFVVTAEKEQTEDQPPIPPTLITGPLQRRAQQEGAALGRFGPSCNI